LLAAIESTARTRSGADTVLRYLPDLASILLDDDSVLAELEPPLASSVEVLTRLDEESSSGTVGTVPMCTTTHLPTDRSPMRCYQSSATC